MAASSGGTEQRRAGLTVALLEDRRLVNHHGIQAGRVELEGHLGIGDPDTRASRLSGRPDVADVSAELRRFPYGLMTDGQRRDNQAPAADQAGGLQLDKRLAGPCVQPVADPGEPDRKSTRLNSSHLGISYAVFCL